MKIIINFEAENESFVNDFEGEVRRVLLQAERYIVGQRDSERLKDINGNTVGSVFRSTRIQPRRKDD